MEKLARKPGAKAPAKGAKEKPLKVPEKVGAAVDLLYKMREERKALDAKAAAMKAREEEMENAIFSKFKKQDLEGCRGRAAQCSVSRSEVPTPDDWAAIDKYILKTKDLSLLQRRLGVEAVRERWAEGVAIPGVSKFTKVRLHLTAVKGGK